MLLDGWQRLEAMGTALVISDSEMREMLLKGEDTFRAQALWYLERWVKGTDDRSQAWVRLLPEFLKEVCPDANAPRPRRPLHGFVILRFPMRSSFLG
jgi:hypothetical protein